MLRFQTQSRAFRLMKAAGSLGQQSRGHDYKRSDGKQMLNKLPSWMGIVDYTLKFHVLALHGTAAKRKHDPSTSRIGSFKALVTGTACSLQPPTPQALPQFRIGQHATGSYLETPMYFLFGYDLFSNQGL